MLFALQKDGTGALNQEGEDEGKCGGRVGVNSTNLSFPSSLVVSFWSSLLVRASLWLIMVAFLTNVEMPYPC